MRRSFLSFVSVLAAIAAHGASPDAAYDQVEAVIPVEVLPPDPALAEGQLHISGIKWSSPTIALQPARIARAIVVSDERPHRERLMVMAVLGKGVFAENGTLSPAIRPEQQAWCEYGNNKIPTVECLVDSDGDGRLDIRRQGLRASQSPLSLLQVRGVTQIEPVADRAAREEDLPRYRVGYVNCLPVRTIAPALPEEIRFATTFRPDDDKLHWPVPDTCSQLAFPKKDSATDGHLYQLDRFTIAVSWEGNDLRTRLVKGLTPGTWLGHLSYDRPLMDAATANERITSEIPKRPFLFVSGTPQIPQQVALGELLYQAQVTHGLTGHLSVPVRNLALFKNKSGLPAGAPVFGLAMSSSRQAPGQPPKIVWCAPGATQVKWSTSCVVPDHSLFRMVQVYDPFVLMQLSVSSNSDGATAALVDPGPVDFGGPLTLNVRFTKMDAKEVEVRWTVGTKSNDVETRMQLPRATDGSAYIMIGAQILKLIPDAGKLAVEVTGTPDVNSEALPQDPRRMIQSLMREHR